MDVDTQPLANAVRALLVGEVLWDRFPDADRLGGAPLNVAAHLLCLGHTPLLLSAVGTDVAGCEARATIEDLGLETTLLQSTDRFPTGNAVVTLGPGDDTSFTIERPAAYDAIDLTDAVEQRLVSWQPDWLYYGTLFPSREPARQVLFRVMDALGAAQRFYDVNLRPGFGSVDLVDALLRAADVVKLNERELQFVHQHLGLPADAEGCCRAGAARYGWTAACVTFGARGCGMLIGRDYVAAPGHPVDVVDPVGAGDAFSAAFIQGLASGWPASQVAETANCLGAHVAANPGAIPDLSRP